MKSHHHFPKEYQYGLGFKIFLCVGIPFPMALFIVLGYLSVTSILGTIYLSIFFFIVSISMITSMTLGLIEVFKSKFIIDNDRFIEIGIFSKREIPFSEVKGYREVQAITPYQTYHNYCIVPKNKSRKIIKIPTYVGNHQEIFEFLESKFDSLDVKDEEESKKKIFSNPKFGRNEDERKQFFKKFRLVIKILNFIAIQFAFWIIFYPYPYKIAVSLAIALPLISILLVILSKGIIDFFDKKNHLRPSVAYAFLLFSIPLALRAFLDYNLIDYSKLLTYILISTAVISFIVFKIVSRESDKRFLYGLLIALFVLVYAYGSITIINCLYDYSSPEIYPVKVIDKRISPSSVTVDNFYLKIEPWGPIESEKEVAVSRLYYDNIEVGNIVNVHMRNGLFNIRWYYLGN